VVCEGICDVDQDLEAERAKVLERAPLNDWQIRFAMNEGVSWPAPADVWCMKARENPAEARIQFGLTLASFDAVA
jgi:hypothetical protein